MIEKCGQAERYDNDTQLILSNMQMTFENTVAKGDIVHNEQLSFLPQFFKPYPESIF